MTVGLNHTIVVCSACFDRGSSSSVITARADTAAASGVAAVNGTGTATMYPCPDPPS